MDKIALLSLTFALFFPKELTHCVPKKCLLNFISFYCSQATSLAVLLPEGSGPPFVGLTYTNTRS